MTFVWVLGFLTAFWLLGMLCYFQAVNEGPLGPAIVVLPFVAALIAIGFGAIWWLRHDVWGSVSIAQAVAYLAGPQAPLVGTSEWKGLGRLLDWLFEQNVAWLFGGAGLVALSSADHWGGTGYDVRARNAVGEPQGPGSA